MAQGLGLVIGLAYPGVRLAWATSRAQAEREATYRTVAGYQRRPPCAVGTRTEFNPSAIAAKLLPAARSRWMRLTTFVGKVAGLPIRTP
jgi:hypothetical protein